MLLVSLVCLVVPLTMPLLCLFVPGSTNKLIDWLVIAGAKLYHLPAVSALRGRAGTPLRGLPLPPRFRRLCSSFGRTKVCKHASTSRRSCRDQIACIFIYKLFAVIAQQFRSTQTTETARVCRWRHGRVHNGQVVCDSDAEHMGGSRRGAQGHAPPANQWPAEVVRWGRFCWPCRLDSKMH